MAWCSAKAQGQLYLCVINAADIGVKISMNWVVSFIQISFETLEGRAAVAQSV
jgi:hypothetical protein